MQSKPLTIIIPTYDNPQYLDGCLDSLYRLGIIGTFAKVLIINNGKTPVNISATRGVDVIEAGGNLGWEGGLKLGLKHTDSPYVCFLNDDTFIPQANGLFFQRALVHFTNPKIAAVGPSTTMAAGIQSVFSPYSTRSIVDVRWLIFFCVIVRRSALEEVGGIDTTLPGGDDFDLSIRLNQAGYRIVFDPGLFLIHHGFKTGERVHGGAHVDGGWNSLAMTERTNNALIKKHGFRTFFETLRGQVKDVDQSTVPKADIEGDIVRGYLNGHKKVVELGCGATKTVDESIGVDKIGSGEAIDTLYGDKSVADVQGDVAEKLPFEDASQEAVIARHILEHCLDGVKALREWQRILKPGGRLILAVPDERVTNGIPLNPEHVHAFAPDSLQSLVESVGFKHVESKYANNGMSFVACYEKGEKDA